MPGETADAEETKKAKRQTDPPFWKVPLEFALHGTIGVGVWLAVAIPAVGLNYLSKYMEELKVDPIIVGFLRGGEYLLIGADGITFVVFLCKTVWRTSKKL